MTGAHRRSSDAWLRDAGIELSDPEEAALELHDPSDPDDGDAEAASVAALPISGGHPWYELDAHGIVEASLPVPDLLVPEMQLGPGRPCAIWGSPGSGKNWTAQAIALAVASGRPALARFDVTRSRVLHVSYDMGAVATTLRYRQLANGMGIARDELLGWLSISIRPAVSLTTTGIVESLAEKLHAGGFRLLVLDNARDSAPAVDENSSQFGEILGRLGEACELADATAIYLHHTRKPLQDSDGDPTAASGRGTGAILARSGCVWAVHGDGDDPRKLIHLRQHDLCAEQLDTMWLYRVDGCHSPQPLDVGGRDPEGFHLMADEDGPDSGSQSARVAEVAEQVADAVSANPGLGTTGIREAVPGVRRELLSDAINDLLACGRIEDRGKGGARSPRSYYPKGGS